MSISTLTRRTHALQKRLAAQPAKAWSFVLLGDQELTPEQRAQIGPQDTVYIRRIHLTHEAYNLL